MDRRGFLKLLGGGAVAGVAAAVGVKVAFPERAVSSQGEVWIQPYSRENAIAQLWSQQLQKSIKKTMEYSQSMTIDSAKYYSFKWKPTRSRNKVKTTFSQWDKRMTRNRGIRSFKDWDARIVA